MAHHLAQLNVARPAVALDSPTYGEFIALLPTINALADAAPGFVWRLVDEGGQDAQSLRPFDAETMVNLSVWESVEALRAYVYRSAHLDPLRRRREWFVPPAGPHHVLWWIGAGELPEVAEAGRRLATLTREGPGPEAFTLRDSFDPTGERIATLTA
jgi:hypothetical protein